MAVLTLQFQLASFVFFIWRSLCVFFKFLAAARKIFANAIACTLEKQQKQEQIQRQRQKFKCSPMTKQNESKNGRIWGPERGARHRQSEFLHKNV